jgi:hypothetical protein
MAAHATQAIIDSDYRHAIVACVDIVYALGDEPKGHETLTILRVIHGARDWREEGWPG